MGRIAAIFTRYFVLWLVFVACVAFFMPQFFLPLAGYVPYLLGLIMLCMGLTLRPRDFALVMTRPRDVAIGVIARYVIMPGVAFCVAHLLQLPPALAAGLVLVGCCPSGTASNIITYLARGDMALSVTVSSMATIFAPLLTPYIFLLLAGSFIPIDALKLLKDIMIMVVLPVVAGTSIRFFFAHQVEKVRNVIPAASVISIMITIGAVISINAERLQSVALIALVAVMLHNGAGLLLGYWTARLTGMSVYKSKAISFEIGIENSGLAVTLALAHLDPVAAIPGAIFTVWHNLSGSALASYWASKAGKDGEVPGISCPSADGR